jgi:hypothetical protein
VIRFVRPTFGPTLYLVTDPESREPYRRCAERQPSLSRPTRAHSRWPTPCAPEGDNRTNEFLAEMREATSRYEAWLSSVLEPVPDVTR